MSKYQNGKIYKIVSNGIDQVYIGSTYQALSARMSGHRMDFKRCMNGVKQKFCTSFSVLEYGDAEIILIENCPCESKEELNARERFHIENNNCVNKVIPGRTPKEYRQLPEVKERENKARRKKYNTDPEHRDKVNKQRREIYQRNKEQRREIYQRNKDKIIEQSREYREKNKDAINEKRRNNRVICEFCGSESQKNHLRRHQRTQKCLACQ